MHVCVVMCVRVNAWSYINISSVVCVSVPLSTETLKLEHSSVLPGTSIEPERETTKTSQGAETEELNQTHHM